MRDHVLLYVNGKPRKISGDTVFQSLSKYLRYDERATGTKIVCEEGDCGACTVLLGRVENGRLRYRPINSCIQFLFQLDCTHVVTVEGLSRDGLTPVQEAMVTAHGAQCGYCTPGFIMAMAAMHEPDGRSQVAGRGSQMSVDEVKKGLTGNLCRCTGYEPIIRAALDVKKQPTAEDLYPSEAMLRDFAAHCRDEVWIGNFCRPADLAGAIEFKASHPKCVIVQGGTDFGVWRNKRDFAAEALLSLSAIEGLGDIRLDDGTIEVGGRVTLAAFEDFTRDLVSELAGIMERFGSPQIKNAGTLAGNIANASPIADTLPFLYVTDARLELTGRNGARVVPIASFYKGYKTLDLRPDEIITRIFVPLPKGEETLRLYKVSKRSHLDISSFTAAMLMRRAGNRIDSIRIAYGGVAPVVLRLPETEKFLAGKPFDRNTLDSAGEIAAGEVKPISDVRGSAEYRLQLAKNILSKFYYDAI